MIFGASLGPFVKKALVDKGFQTNVNKIIETLPMDPQVSNMDAVVMGPKDLNGPLSQMLTEAVKKKHASVEILYFYQKDKEAEMIDGDVKKIKVQRVNLEGIQEGIERVIALDAVGRDSRVIDSADNKAHSLGAEWIPPKPVVPEEAAAETAAAIEPAEIKTFPTLEQRILAMAQFADFNFFKQALEIDNVVSDLLQENTQYAALVNMLEALDYQMALVFQDTSLTAEARFEKIRQIGIDGSAYRGIESSLLADKMSSIMEAILTSAEATVEHRVGGIRNALGIISAADLLYEDQGKLQKLIESRLTLQMDLMELSKELIEVYMAMDRSVTDLIADIGEERPSGNDYINEMMKSVKFGFLPQNIAAITNRLIGDLHRKRVALSIIEEKVKSLVHLVFKLCEEDATIIDCQQKLINLLMAQKVENVVIVDNLIKYCLRIFVGPADTGRTATALTWSGVVSRRRNALLLDLTGNSKLRQYGVEPVSLDVFMGNRLECQLLCVEGNLDEDLERADTIVSELKTRLNYYGHINVLLDASQTDLLNRLAPSALSVHFITDCTPRGTSLLKPCIEAFGAENVARKVIMIAPPLDPMRMFAELSLDPLLVKLVILPHLQHLRACSLNRIRPYESREVVEVFEEAFR